MGGREGGRDRVEGEREEGGHKPQKGRERVNGLIVI